MRVSLYFHEKNSLKLCTSSSVWLHKLKKDSNCSKNYWLKVPKRLKLFSGGSLLPLLPPPWPFFSLIVINTSVYCGSIPLKYALWNFAVSSDMLYDLFHLVKPETYKSHLYVKSEQCEVRLMNFTKCFLQDVWYKSSHWHHCDLNMSGFFKFSLFVNGNPIKHHDPGLKKTL